MMINTFVEEFATANREEKIKFLFKYYEVIETRIQVAREAIKYTIKNEQEYYKKASLEGLGVRVSSGKYADKTANEAINNIMLEDSISNGTFPIDISKMSEKEQRRWRKIQMEIEPEISCLVKMQDLFHLLEKEIKGLGKEKSEMLLKSLNKEKTPQELADEYNISYKAMNNRIRRAKDKIIERMESYVKEEVVGHGRKE